MKKVSTLNKDAVLWHVGDCAKTIGLVERGRLGIRTEKGMVGVILPKMILGEAAILVHVGQEPRRTAEVFALDNDTCVAEYPVSLIKQGSDDGVQKLRIAVLGTLLGQICRNCLLVTRANSGIPHRALPIKGLMESLVQTQSSRLQAVLGWDTFLTEFHFLFETRNYSETVRRYFVPGAFDKESAQRASEVVAEVLKHAGDLSLIQDFMKAEVELLELDDTRLKEATPRAKAAPQG